MKKTLCTMLTMALLLTSNAFAAPVSETVESAEENITAAELLDEDAELAEETTELEAYNIVKYGLPVYFDDFENPAAGFKGGVGKGEGGVNPLSIVETDESNHAVMFPARPSGVSEYCCHVYAYTKMSDAKWSDSSWKTEFELKEGTNYTFVADAKAVSKASRWFDSVYLPTGTVNAGSIKISTDEWSTFSYSFANTNTQFTNIYVGGNVAKEDFYLDNVGLFGKPSEEYTGSLALANSNISFSGTAYTVTVDLPTELDETYAAAIEKAPSALGENIIAATVSGKVLTLAVNGSATGSQTLKMPDFIVKDGTQIIPACALSYTAEKVSKNFVLYGKEVYFDDFENPAEGFNGGISRTDGDDNPLSIVATDESNHAVKFPARPSGVGSGYHFYAYTKTPKATHNGTPWRTEFELKAGTNYTFVADAKAAEAATTWFHFAYLPKPGTDGKILYGADVKDLKGFGISAYKWSKFSYSFTSSVTGFTNISFGGKPATADFYLDNVGLFGVPAATLKANVIDSDKTNRTVKLKYKNGLWSSAAASVNAFGSELVDGAVLSYDETENVLKVVFDENTDTVTVPALIAADEENSYEAIEVCLLDRIATLSETDFKASVLGYSNSGIRFKGTVSNTLKAEADTAEYGFLVALNSALGGKELAFDTTKTNTPDKACTTADGVRFIYAMNYDKASGIDKYLNRTYNDGADTLFSAVLVNITPEHYKDLFSVRAYVKAGNEYLYGDTVTQSIYETAKAKKAEYVNAGKWDSLDDTTKVAIDDILTNAGQA